MHRAKADRAIGVSRYLLGNKLVRDIDLRETRYRNDDELIDTCFLDHGIVEGRIRFAITEGLLLFSERHIGGASMLELVTMGVPIDE